MTKVYPSVLASDLSHLADEAALLQKNGADGIHFDVMDGHFVPNITFGPGTCAALKSSTSLPIDVHLMVSEPSEWVNAFADAGASLITFHVEAENHIHRTLQLIKNRGVKCGIAINPCTSLDVCKYALPFCDVVLIMSVNPGFGGQSFIDGIAGKIAELDSIRRKESFNFEIEVDGGINEVTAPNCINAGADILVAGSAVFKAADMKKEIVLIRG